MKAEVRGNGKVWKVSYPDESGIPSLVRVFDKEGNLTGTVKVGAPTEKMVESHFTGLTKESAVEYAYSLGATEVTVVRTRATSSKVERAREERQKARAIAKRGL